MKEHNVAIIQLNETLSACGSPNFEAILKKEIARLETNQLPLQQGLVSSNYVTDDPITAIINLISDMDEIIQVKAGIFYKGIMGGCNCADDPTPDSKNNEYCEVQLDIDKVTGKTLVALVTK